MDGGGEQRVQMREEPLWRWSGVRRNFEDDADVNGLVAWFLARRGAQFGFLFADARDFTTRADGIGAPTPLDQVIGFGDGVRTRFRLRKQYSDPGGMTACTFPRRVVPLLGTATAPMARLFGINTGASIAPAAAVAGVTDASATFLPLSHEVELSAAPAIGTQVTWGGYFAVPARFAESTDQGLEATIAGFQSDEAPFEVESIPFDDPVPLVPGGSPYGHVLLASQTTSFELSARRALYFEIDADAPINGYLDDLNNYPTGGPHLFVVNTGGSTITVRDSLGASVGTITATNSKWLFVKEDAWGNRTPVLL
jgi:uncharacterized protein (TIGR02217 family)